ncbi:hypothetical protein NKG95_32520 [Mesorhizobium sp. M1423]|uniref:hypothetical protein n=1 Tax=Mesorhizobium sp. M1423 TaxID=2957101 RepID=UPI0033355872
MIKPIHPFPARMAPEIALDALSGLPVGSVILDPMIGSGTVCRQASDLGHIALGFDVDPLAVLMTRIWTTPVDDRLVLEMSTELFARAKELDRDEIILDWMDSDPETLDFSKYWFGERQRVELRKFCYLLEDWKRSATAEDEKNCVDLMRLALSRIIITKESGASLARDVSHSRPHKVTDETSYNVTDGFAKSIGLIRTRLSAAPPSGNVHVGLGDARCMDKLKDGSVDAVLTSPPYLNAIDYLRGHRLSLIWLGHKLGDLRTIRSNGIGTERSPDSKDEAEAFTDVRRSIGDIERLPPRFQNMIDRYVQDIRRLLAEISRVLRSGGQATFIVGNSCLRGCYIGNSDAVAAAAAQVGLLLVAQCERELPNASRYLPLTSDKLAKRMRTEVIQTFRRAA